MKKKAVFPGSFDPVTLGHVNVIQRAVPLFDELIIAIGTNDAKKYRFSLDERLAFLQQTFSEYSNIKIATYTGLTTEFCKEVNADFLLRGLRNPADFEFEKAIAITNRKLSGIDTVFLLTSADTSFISSSIVRDIIKHKGDLSKFAPQAVVDACSKN
ncbi:pantetheine-phosphate adenylyltransferase [Wenyingzhuangia sp. 2_MG-2023]|uniref:pantetheine-phosphate adenylyltransferase n=1 Tax=Wenyingzhuangia sp. 2_MG-2023 TaxID=3062639 RepID=UPI0026E31EA8|nr:pantetheine-phosphate adenylyltransferase [Wenyingzhuangia sp. 2_MG-2023]MDO6737193.1 pantetheine-phosphate adenylyltransferase [Wenyingzhuangia sp. 2_MG-2023]